MIIASALLSAFLLSFPVPPAATVPVGVVRSAQVDRDKCMAALDAQDETMRLMRLKIDELNLALAARKAEAELREREAVLYKAMWVESQAETARVRKLAFWSDKLIAIKWGAVGFAGGVIVERVAE